MTQATVNRRISFVKTHERCRDYSNGILDKIRTQLAPPTMGDAVIVTCGSYARREASSNSDVDFFVLSNQDGADKTLVGQIGSRIREVVPHGPAGGGAFGTMERCADMVRNIGGNDDDNRSITRRVLLLLEGEWIYNGDGLCELRKDILARYIAEGVADHQLTLFLLNDIIRYYRTVAVDYEFKTVEEENPKPWAIRNIKLIFSRKLMYASGLFSVAMTVDKARSEKIDLLADLFGCPVIERMVRICGPSRMKPILDSYDMGIIDLT